MYEVYFFSFTLFLTRLYKDHIQNNQIRIYLLYPEVDLVHEYIYRLYRWRRTNRSRGPVSEKRPGPPLLPLGNNKPPQTGVKSHKINARKKLTFTSPQYICFYFFHNRRQKVCSPLVKQRQGSRAE